MAFIKFIVKEYGHWRINGAIRSALRNTMAKESTIYALNLVSVEKDCLVATNGRKIVFVNHCHDIEHGLYHVTQDGFLLKETEPFRFPKASEILLKKGEYQIDNLDCLVWGFQRLFSMICYKINKRDIGFDLYMMQDSLKALLKTYGGTGLSIKTISAERAIQIEFAISAKADSANITYVQMPIMG